MTTILDRLTTIVEELISLHNELAFAKVSDLQAKHSAYISSEEVSHAGRERFAAHSTIHITSQIITLEGRISSLQEEKYHLIRLLELENKNA